MIRLPFLCFCALLVLTACKKPEPISIEVSGAGKEVFWIDPNDNAMIQYRSLDAVNLLRQDKGLRPLKLSPALIAAAQTHASDMARQQRPWHFGSDGSSPLERAKRAGYEGIVLGENISETFEDDLFTIAAWNGDKRAHRIIMHPDARLVGLAWFQEKDTGKIWWVQVVGTY